MRKFVFVGTFLTHYVQNMLAKFMEQPGTDWTFVATKPFSKTLLGWGLPDGNMLPYAVRAYESPGAMDAAQKLITEADCVIGAGVPAEVLGRRLEGGKITFMQSERFFKGPLWKDACRFLKYIRYSGGRSQARSPRSKFYLLCAGAFAAWDYYTCGLFRGKAYRWGYFPEVRRYGDVAGLISRKKPGSLLWAGRYIPRKHPEIALKLAANLRDMGLDFTLRIMGSGIMENELQVLAQSYGLNDIVHLNTGKGVGPEEIRAEMEKSQVFLFTSGRWEGWGAVLNEAMNSGCACVAGGKIGSVPYLIRDGVNGLVFRDKDADGLTEKVAGLLRNPARISQLGWNAYETVTGEWSADEAAGRFVRLAEELDTTAGPVRLWEDGPGSVAPVI